MDKGKADSVKVAFYLAFLFFINNSSVFAACLNRGLKQTKPIAFKTHDCRPLKLAKLNNQSYFVHSDRVTVASAMLTEPSGPKPESIVFLTSSSKSTDDKALCKSPKSIPPVPFCRLQTNFVNLSAIPSDAVEEIKMPAPSSKNCWVLLTTKKPLKPVLLSCVERDETLKMDFQCFRGDVESPISFNPANAATYAQGLMAYAIEETCFDEVQKTDRNGETNPQSGQSI